MDIIDFIQNNYHYYIYSVFITTIVYIILFIKDVKLNKETKQYEISKQSLFWKLNNLITKPVRFLFAIHDSSNTFHICRNTLLNFIILLVLNPIAVTILFIALMGFIILFSIKIVFTWVVINPFKLLILKHYSNMKNKRNIARIEQNHTKQKEKDKYNHRYIPQVIALSSKDDDEYLIKEWAMMFNYYVNSPACRIKNQFLYSEYKQFIVELNNYFTHIKRKNYSKKKAALIKKELVDILGIIHNVFDIEFEVGDNCANLNYDTVFNNTAFEYLKNVEYKNIKDIYTNILGDLEDKLSDLVIEYAEYNIDIGDIIDDCCGCDCYDNVNYDMEKKAIQLTEDLQMELGNILSSFIDKNIDKFKEFSDYHNREFFYKLWDLEQKVSKEKETIIMSQRAISEKVKKQAILINVLKEQKKTKRKEQLNRIKAHIKILLGKVCPIITIKNNRLK